MMLEINRRPDAKPPGRVTGWPTQQKAGRQPPLANRQPQRSTGKISVQNRPATATRKPMQSFGRGPQGFPANTRRPSSGNSGAGKPFSNLGGNKQPSGTSRTGGTSRPGNRVPVSQGVRRPSPGRGINRPHLPPVYQPVYNNRRSYIFDPVQTIPPKDYAEQDDKNIPRQDKVPGNLPDKEPCNCRHSGNGCTTLSGFAFGNAELTDTHQQKIEVLANTIHQNNTTSVTCTGHTDASGAEDYNMYLGIHRAITVRKQLIKKLHELKPWSQTSIFFRTVTKGETEPVSDTDNNLNRRVTVCLQ